MDWQIVGKPTRKSKKTNSNSIPSSSQYRSNLKTQANKASISQKSNNSINLDDNVTNLNLTHTDYVFKIQCFIGQLINAVQFLRDSELFHFLRSKIVQKDTHFSTVVCLGVGNFSTSTSSYWQFALYLCLRKFLLLQSELEDADIILHDIFIGKINEDSFFYEPNITEFEKSVCNSLGIHVCHLNLFGQYKLPAVNNDNVLFFMPHCPYQLYCNLIWTNCTELNRLYILGNR